MLTAAVILALLTLVVAIDEHANATLPLGVDFPHESR